MVKENIFLKKVVFISIMHLTATNWKHFDF